MGAATMTDKNSDIQRRSEAADQVSRRRFIRNSSIGVGAAAITGSRTELIGAAPVLRDEDSDPSAHFHHVHLNVTDPRRTRRFYEFVFGAVSVRFRGAADALFTGRSFILMNHVGAPPPSALESGIWHIGWGGVDVPNEYLWWKSKGIDVHTDIYPLGTGHVTYWNGPDQELIEINTQGHHRYSHVHLFAKDVNVTGDWFTRQLGLPGLSPVPKPADMSKVRAWSSWFRCDNVNFGIYGMPDYTPSPPWWRWEPLAELKPQTGRAIDHIAFSYPDIGPAFDRMKKNGVEIVAPIKFDPQFGLKSFYIMSPDQVLVEIVEAKPIPEGVWDD
jgi:catechol 2,3-dioxygenase-like lactoylglutathione lyase family enzyme